MSFEFSEGVKNKIATFEEQNEKIRKTTIPLTTSPPRGRATEAVASTSSTATSQASESRRSRIQRQVSKSPMRTEPQPMPEQGHLKELRRARQQQQRERLAETTSRKSAQSSAASKRTTTSVSAQASKTRLSSGNHSQTLDDHRGVTNNSMERHEGDEALPMSRSPREGKLAKAKRMQRMRRTRSPTRAGGREAIILKESDTYFNHLLTPHIDEDDEITETSVRQIMKEDERGRRHEPLNLLARASSSSFDTEGDSIEVPPTTNTATSSFLLSRSNSSSKAAQASSIRAEDDERTFDYGDRDEDEDSQASITYEQRKQMERKAREEKVKVDTTENSPLLNKEDMEFIGKKMDTPVAKTAVGVVAAASIGAIVLGPVGLLVGAATVGLGIGILQIPEEQRTQAVKKARESAIEASEKLTSTCAASCHDAGVTEHMPPELTHCFSVAEDESNSMKQENEDPPQAGQAKGVVRQGVEQHPGPSKIQQGNGQETRKTASPPHGRAGKRRAAVLRLGKTTPVNQIYSLEPAKQQRAWLDVMASAETTEDEKNEALEEIIILAKDKGHARFFLEEGILDSLMWMMSPFLEGPRKPGEARNHSSFRRAAICCTTLGKAHCAAVHTGGDLLLMSMYERGSVPEERQLAQMLYEVPHHVQVTKSAEEGSFVLKTLTMPQAEELASSITALASGVIAAQ